MNDVQHGVICVLVALAGWVLVLRPYHPAAIIRPPAGPPVTTNKPRQWPRRESNHPTKAVASAGFTRPSALTSWNRGMDAASAIADTASILQLLDVNVDGQVDPAEVATFMLTLKLVCERDSSMSPSVCNKLGSVQVRGREHHPLTPDKGTQNAVLPPSHHPPPCAAGARFALL